MMLIKGYRTETAGIQSLHFTLQQPTCRMRSTGLTCKRASLPQLWWCESLARASAAGGDNSDHKYCCWAHCQPSWTQWRGKSAPLFTQFCHGSVVCEGWGWTLLCPAFPDSPRAVGAAPHPFTPMISSLPPSHPENVVVLQWRAGLSDTPSAEEFDDNYLVTWAHWQRCGEDRWTLGHAMHNSL